MTYFRFQMVRWTHRPTPDRPSRADLPLPRRPFSRTTCNATGCRWPTRLIQRDDGHDAGRRDPRGGRASLAAGRRRRRPLTAMDDRGSRQAGSCEEMGRQRATHGVDDRSGPYRALQLEIENHVLRGSGLKAPMVSFAPLPFRVAMWPHLPGLIRRRWSTRRPADGSRHHRSEVSCALR